MGYVTLESLIPAGDPDKRAIESAVMQAFSDLVGGPWRISITRPAMAVADAPKSWSVCVAGGTSVRVGALRSSADVMGFMARTGFGPHDR
jgi:hypothetical protein